MHEDLEMHRLWLRQAKQTGILCNVPRLPLERAVVAAVHTHDSWRDVSAITGLQVMKAKHLYVAAMSEVRAALESRNISSRK
ncbi:hypothetical protein [Streptomyces bauhiniae]